MLHNQVCSYFVRNDDNNNDDEIVDEDDDAVNVENIDIPALVFCC